MLYIFIIPIQCVVYKYNVCCCFVFKYYMLNNEKPSHITFTLKQNIAPSMFLKNNIILSTDVRYLGLIPDKRPTWVEHIKQKKLLLNSIRKSLFTILGKHSKLGSKNKLLLYKTLLKPIWSYGIKL